VHPSLCGLRLVAEILALAVEVFGVRGRNKAQKRLRELLVNTPVLGFPRGSVGKESSCSVGDLGCKELSMTEHTASLPSPGLSQELFDHGMLSHSVVSESSGL